MNRSRAPVIDLALRSVLDGVECQLEEVDGVCADAQWRSHLGQATGDELARLEQARSDMLLDDQMRTLLCRWESRPCNPLLARRVNLLLRRVRWAEIESQPQVYQLRNRIDHAVVNYRPKISGAAISRVERSDILRRHPDRARRCDAWLAMGHQINQIEAYVRQLMRRRQALARERGYDDFVSWALDTVGLSRIWVEGFFDELRRGTEAPYRSWMLEMAERLSLQGGLRPWDLAFAAEQGMALPETAFPSNGALTAAKAVAKGLGLGDAASGVRVDVADTPYAALCYAVHPPDDVRILLNPRNGRVHYDVLFHEFGHAIHWRCLRPKSPILRWESSLFNEAMACIWERIVSEPDWLIQCAKVTPEQVADFRIGWTKRAIYRLRLRMAQATFEYRAYQQLDADLLALYRDVYAEYLGVPYDFALVWADAPFWTSHPVYLHNYVIGEAVASQTLAALRRRFGRFFGNPQAGAWLAQHYFGPAAELPWEEKIMRATGAPPGTADLVVDLGCAVEKEPLHK